LKKILKYSVPLSSPGIRKLIKGDNLDVLQCLKIDWANKIDCIYIDPPYNNGEKFEHYNDQKTNNWEFQITKRIKLLHQLLSEEGSIWVSIDDSELYTLKNILDKVFNPKNFVVNIIWNHRKTKENRKLFSPDHEYILVYAKDKKIFSKKANKEDGTNILKKRYKNPDNDPRGPWQSISLNVQNGHAVKSQYYAIISPNGKKHAPPKGRCWAYNETRMLKEIDQNNVWFGKDGNGVPRRKKFLNDSKLELSISSIWHADEVGTTDNAKKHLIQLLGREVVFDTPKPEKLLKKILEIATNEGDLILDAYAGSGTSLAVAHKVNRHYIGIDNNDYFKKFTTKRLKLVDKNQDNGLGFEFFEWKN